MKIINARKFNNINDWIDDDTLEEIRGYESGVQNNFEVYDAEANEEELPILEIDEDDEEAMGYLADNYVQTEEPLSVMEDTLQEVGNFRRRQEGLPGEDILEDEPEIKTREEVEVDEVDESVAEATEPDERVPDFATTAQAIQAAIDENRVMEIFYVTKGRGSRNEKKYLKRERDLQRTDTGGVHIHRIVEPHFMYTAGNGNLIAVTYDRSIGRGFIGHRDVDSNIRAYIVDNIYDYNFTKNRKTKEDQYFKPKIDIRQSSGKGIYTMKNINDKLVKIASTLDNKGLKESSSVVKDAIKAATNYKKAQYVGVQGYWLRNRRCWDNCYRHKRTTQPGTPAQEVWMECWDEYNKAINNNQSTWGKYAGTDDSFKTGSKKTREWDGIFAKKVESKMVEGLNRPEAIYSVIESESQAHMTKVIQASSNLMDLADTLASNGHDKIGREMAAVSIGMLKEAQIQGNPGMWGRIKQKAGDWFSGKGGKSDVIKKIQNVIQRANELLSQLNIHNQPVQKTQSKSTGFIIEAGKGTKIVEAQPAGTPTRMGPKPIGKTDPETGKQKYRATPADQEGDKDGDTVPDSEDKDDTPPDNKPDAPQAEDAPQETTPPEPDKDGDTVPDSEDRDDSPPDNKPDLPQPEDTQTNPQQTQAKESGLNQSYLSLVKDVSGMVQEFSGLQQAEDPQVAQYAQGAVPLLQNFVGNSSQLRQLPPGTQQRQALRNTLQQLATDLQSILAGQPAGQADMLPGGQEDGLPGVQPGGQEGVQMGNSNLETAPQRDLAQGIGQAAQAVLNMAPQYGQQIMRGGLTQEQTEWVMTALEKHGVPPSMANWEAMKQQMGAAGAQSKAAQVVSRKRK